MDRESHPAEKRYAFKRPTSQARVYLRCACCGTKSIDDSAFCAQCGASLLGPGPYCCLACGSEILTPSDRHCGDCGAYLPKASRPPKLISPWSSRLFKALAATAVAAGLWLGAQGIGNLRTPFLQAPSLAGIKVGDPQQAVERRIGKPDIKPTEVFWNGRDGKPHRVGLWKYGLTPDSEVANLTVTFLDGKVYQVGVLDKVYRTSEGLRVGDRIAKASRLYGTPIEENLVSGLLPMKYLRQGVVVKIVTMPGNDRVLAVGIESPRALPTVGSDEGIGEGKGSERLDRIQSTPL
ncbi:zinc ribbon domain-containing protein [bacterium]|nr:zinc ribbon domain-containing protein [bacterium]